MNRRWTGSPSFGTMRACPGRGTEPMNPLHMLVEEVPEPLPADARP